MPAVAATQAILVPRWELDLIQLRDDVETAQVDLAIAEDISDAVHEVVLSLGDRLEAISDSDLQEVDPYFVLAIQGGTIQALRALELIDRVERRRGVRMGLERVRQSLRDVGEEEALADDRPVKLVVRWLVETLDAPYPRVAALLRTSPRTLQRWLSTETSQPRGKDAARVRFVAKVTNQLRHALSAEGVLLWFETPRADLGKKRPADLLSDLSQAPRLVRLAASARVSIAT